MNPIHHAHEPKSNGLRERLDASTGRAQRTHTPTLSVIERAKGVNLYTADGKRLIDFAAGVLVANLGHDHKAFEEKFAAYSAGLPRSSYNMLTPIEVEAAERLLRAMNSEKAQQLLWAASGSEAIQKALWCARARRPERPIMLATRRGFHGKKGLAGDVSGEESPNPDVRFISFPTSDDDTPEPFEAELEELAKNYPDEICLLITEPYLGAAGSFHPPKWYMQLLQDWCAKHDIAFIFDEVQSCHGRTGNMFAYQSYGVEPDLVVLGKGLGNGEPVAAVAGRGDLISALDYGEASDTFSGNPRACAAVCAVLDVFEAEDVVGHVRAMTPILRAKLDALIERHDFIHAVRGEGFVYGVECASETIARECVLEAYLGHDGVGVHFLGPLSGKVLRVSPPLVATEAELNEAFKIIDHAWARIEVLEQQA